MQSPEIRESAGRCTVGHTTWAFPIRTHRANFGTARDGDGALAGLGEPEL